MSLRLSDGFHREGVHRGEHPFFQRYGINLPSSLTRVRSSALVYSTSPPVSVSGTGSALLPTKPFVPVQVLTTCGVRYRTHSYSLLSLAAYQLERSSSDRSPSPSGSHAFIARTGAGISTCCPSPTPCGLGLGPTNPLRSARAAEALGLRRWGFSPHNTLLIPTFALVFTPHRLPLMVLSWTTLPYHSRVSS